MLASFDEKMSISIKDEPPRQGLHPSWPVKLFANPRYFDRKAENQPYIDWLRETFYDSCGNNGSSSESEDDTKEGTSEDGEESEALYLSSDGEDGTPKQTFQRFKNANRSANSNQKSDVRLFMEGLPGSEDCLPYRDQVRVVARFCEQAALHRPDSERAGTEKKIALLLDGGKHGDGISRTQSRRWPYHGPLTSGQLKAELSRKVVELPSCTIIFPSSYSTAFQHRIRAKRPY
jgi:hypothetical protein